MSIRLRCHHHVPPFETFDDHALGAVSLFLFPKIQKKKKKKKKKTRKKRRLKKQKNTGYLKE